MYQYDGENRLTTTTQQDSTQTTTARYAYDNNGNLLSKMDEVSKKIDPANTPKPHFGIFIAGQTTQYMYEYDKVVLEVDGKGNQTARNVYGTNLVSRTAGGQTLYYMYNGHADVTALIGTTEQTVATYYYDAFGNQEAVSGSADNPYRYAGYRYDGETGLYYLNARYYDATTARFLSEDTYSGKANDALSLNLYTYCSNNPIKYLDPTGHWQQGDENLTQKARIEISRLTDLYCSAKTDAQRQAIHDAANDIRDSSANKATTTQNSVTGQNANNILSTTTKRDSNGQAYMTASQWNSVSTTKNDDVVVKAVDSSNITQSAINTVAASKPTQSVNSGSSQTGGSVCTQVYESNSSNLPNDFYLNVGNYGANDDSGAWPWYDSNFVTRHNLGTTQKEDTGSKSLIGGGLQLAQLISPGLSFTGGIEFIWYFDSDFDRNKPFLYSDKSAGIPYVYFFCESDNGASLLSGDNGVGKASEGLKYVIDALSHDASNPKVWAKSLTNFSGFSGNASLFGIVANDNFNNAYDYVGGSSTVSGTLDHVKLSSGKGDSGDYYTFGVGGDTSLVGYSSGEANYVLFKPQYVESMLSGISNAFSGLKKNVASEYNNANLNQ